jgi:hypothetical protein
MTRKLSIVFVRFVPPAIRGIGIFQTINKEQNMLHIWWWTDEQSQAFIFRDSNETALSTHQMLSSGNPT